MNIVILKNNLKEGLQIIAGVKKESSHLPVLKNFLLETKNGTIALSSTDLEIGITHKVSAKVIEQGSVAIPFSIFSQIINNISFERINLETKDNTILISTDNYNANIATAPKDDFPIIPSLKESDKIEFTFPADVLIDAFSSVISSCQLSDIRPELSGILFTTNNSEITFVATDSFRLAEKKILTKKVTGPAEGSVSYIIPLKTVQEIMRIFSSNGNENITMAFDDNQVMISTPTTTLISRLIDGTFPEYHTIIPKEFETNATIEKEDLISALKLSGSLANRLNEVSFKIEKGKNNITIVSSSKELGKSTYTLPAKIKGEKVNITFNWKFVLDGIKTITSKEINIGFNGEEKPSAITSPQDNSFLYIIMPIKSTS